MNFHTKLILLLTIIAPEKSNLMVIEERIVGGQLTTIERYPYQLSLLRNGRHYCGATLLSTTIAITGAHCLHDPPSSYLIRAGTSCINSGGVIMEIQRIITHPYYNQLTIDYDVGLLFFHKPITSGPRIKPVSALPEFNEDPLVSTLGVVTGWGLTSPNNMASISKQLRAAMVPIMDQQLCQRLYEGFVITDRMMCVGYIQGGRDSCMGDSGGPLVVNGQLLGIVSWGVGCAQPLRPGIYTRISRVRRFIRQFAGL